MTDLERIARALVQRTAEFYGDPLPENPNLAFTMVLAQAALAAMPEIAAMREAVAAWMMRHSYATGHGDTLEDLLGELEWQHAEREADRDHWKAECERLREALGWFLADERFQVAVGGNPLVVERMLTEARARLSKP